MTILRCDACGHADVRECGCMDVTILYCQGCGACKPHDGSTCPPQCSVQLFPRPHGVGGGGEQK